MSIDIDWPRLTTGPEGAELAASIRDFIHDKFQQVELPRFIRSVQVHSFDFGDECPSVEIKDFGDPWAEFYEDEGNSDEEEEAIEGHEDLNRAQDRVKEERIPDAFKKPLPLPTTKSESTSAMCPPPKPSKPSYIDTHHPAHPLSPQKHHNSTSSPFLSGSNTPGIPGGTSNLSYFHLPLSAGLNSGTQTPLAAAFGASSLEQHNRSASPVRTHQPGYGAAHWDSRPATGYSNPHTSVLREQEAARAAVGEQEREEDEDDRSQDLQTTLHTTYSGNLSLSLTAEILLDYPMPSFVGIPLALKITGLSFDGVALLTYVSPRKLKEGLRRGSRESEGDETRGRCHFCFLGPEDAKVVIGDAEGGYEEAGEVDGAGGRGTKHKLGKEDNKGLGGLLREIRVETEIGKQENGKQVLKNVGKVEKFILEQVRRIFEEEFVWPSFWTFLV